MLWSIDRVCADQYHIIAGSGLDPLRLRVLLRVSADKLLVFNKSQVQLQVDFYENLLFEVNYEFINESFAYSLG